MIERLYRVRFIVYPFGCASAVGPTILINVIAETIVVRLKQRSLGLKQPVVASVRDCEFQEVTQPVEFRWLYSRKSS